MCDSMSERSDQHWLTPLAFAQRVGCSTHFVRKRMASGILPYRRSDQTGVSVIHRCHIGKFKPYTNATELFTVVDVCRATGLSKQTVCDLLAKREVCITRVGNDRQYETVCIMLDAARPVKRWLIPEQTMRAFKDAVRPNLEGWPTAEEIGRDLGTSTTYVLKLYKAGRIRGQQSVIRQRVHINPSDVGVLDYDQEYVFPINDVSSKTGLAVQTISEIARRGFFTQRCTGPCGHVETKTIRIPSRIRLKRYWFSHSSLSKLMQGVRPFHLNWPTATDFEKHFQLRPGTISRYFNSGRLKGCTSIKGQGQRLHIHPSHVKSMASQIRYSIEDVAATLGITVKTLKTWNRLSPRALLRDGCGRSKYVPPHIVGQLRLIAKHWTLSRKHLVLLQGSDAEVLRAIKLKRLNSIYYDADRPPSIQMFKKGMRVLFPDEAIGVIRNTRPDPYRPAIDVFFPATRAKYIYAVAKAPMPSTGGKIYP